MRKFLLVAFALVVTATVLSAAEPEAPRLNVVRVNLGGLILGPWTGIYGVETAYERVLTDWLGWNVSVWGLNSLAAWGFGLGSSLDFFFVGDAPSGIFFNARTGAVVGEIYGDPVGSLQIGFSFGFQNVFPKGFVLRAGTGASYIVGNRFIPRAVVSVGYAF